MKYFLALNVDLSSSDKKPDETIQAFVSRIISNLKEQVIDNSANSVLINATLSISEIYEFERQLNISPCQSRQLTQGGKYSVTFEFSAKKLM